MAARSRSAPVHPHTQLVADCRTYLKWAKAWQFKVLGSIGQQRGLPDLLSALPPDGRLVAVECKTGTGELTDDQREVRQYMEAAGVLYVVVRSLGDLEDALLSAGLIPDRYLVP